jgi:hypothetical protein
VLATKIECLVVIKHHKNIAILKLINICIKGSISHSYQYPRRQMVANIFLLRKQEKNIRHNKDSNDILQKQLNIINNIF